MSWCMLYITVWVTCSAGAFWWWAAMPEKLWDWCFSVQSAWRISAVNTQLSLWIRWSFAQAQSQSHSSRQVLVRLVSSALRETCFSPKMAPVAASFPLCHHENNCDCLLLDNMLAINQEYWQYIDPLRQSHLLVTCPRPKYLCKWYIIIQLGD